ncbi:MAG TPA: ATP-dependent helicase HrpB [Thermoanaerobaculia bacterium]|nr:ATP-dependent helicase HrpB [Thermoanaerobaculia bacterium]
MRGDLKLVAMSATLDPGPLAAWLGGAPVVESTGSLHPVTIEHLDATDRRLPSAALTGRRPGDIAAVVAWGVRRLLAATEGDLLAFLPGVGEIERTAEALAATAATADVELVPLYGDLPPAAQDAALAGGDRRRVVLATNVAETSVTIEGITGVVDSGWQRLLRHDAASGLDRLELARVSRASADQRAGRAGRLGPGRCLRLWSEHEDRGLAARETPEVARVDPTAAALELFAWGESDPAAFSWFEPPDAAALARAVSLLERLGAIETRSPDGHAITSLGRTMATIPAHPRLARLLVEGRRRGVPAEAALVAAILGERFPLRRRAAAGQPPPPSRSDLLDAADAVAAFAAGRRVPGVDPAASRAALRARDQLAVVGDGSDGGPRPTTAAAREEALLRSILAAFPDRVARRRGAGDPRAVMVGGRGVVIAEASAVREAETFVAVDVAGRRGAGAGGEARVAIASAVETDWLPADRLATTDEVEWDAGRGRAVARRRTRYDDLVLGDDEVPLTASATERAEQLLAAAAAADLEAALGLGEEPVAAFLARLRSLAGWMPELELPDFDAEALRGLLPLLVTGRRSLDELRRVPLVDQLRGLLTPRQATALDREAPERVAVPSGSRVRLEYQPGRPPILAVRIQELFGLAATPRVAADRVPVLLHLLAPNGRPQQVTQDLASFWETTYPQVRKELAGRYPKHSWPDDPLSAEPLRGARRRR